MNYKVPRPIPERFFKHVRYTNKGVLWGSSFLLLSGVLCVLYFTSNNNPYITIIGKINLADGIGRQSVELANELMKKFPTQLVPTNKFKDHLPSKIRRLCAKKVNPQTKIVIYEEPLWYANGKDSISKYLHRIKSRDTILRDIVKSCVSIA